jgi:membrane associated rhomboid family serine protease
MTDAAPSKRHWIESGVGWVAAMLVLMWVVEVIDASLLSDRLEAQGIQPREIGGLDGVVWAPFLHGSFGHLASNSLPFAVLGGLVALRGRGRWFAVSLLILVVSGVATWLFARSGNHIGASGVVFGYLGYLVCSAWWERRFSTIAAAVVAILLYGGLIFGIVPREAVSWEGHLFGLLAGLAAAYATRGRAGGAANRPPA